MKFRMFAILIIVLVTLASGCGTNHDESTTQMGGSIQGKTPAVTGSVSTLAGTAGAVGSLDGIGASARFVGLGGITTDGKNIYVADSDDNTIRKVVISTGAVTTLAGTPGAYGYVDAVGSDARFFVPVGITTDGTNLYVADSGNNVIRKVVIATGSVTTVAGTAGNMGSADGVGASARFSNPIGITTNGANLYVVDLGNNTIRKVEITSKSVTTLAGTVGGNSSIDGTGSAASFSYPLYITTDGHNAYVTDGRTVRKVELRSGSVSTLAGHQNYTSLDPWGSVDGVGSSASFDFPAGITTDGAFLYVQDSHSNVGVSIRKVAIPTGAVSTLSLSAGLADSSMEGVRGAGITTDGLYLYATDLSMTKICKIQ